MHELNACVLCSGLLCITSWPAFVQGDVVHDFSCSIFNYTVIDCFLLREYMQPSSPSNDVMHTAAVSSINPHLYSLSNCNQSDQPYNQRSVMFIPCII